MEYLVDEGDHRLGSICIRRDEGLTAVELNKGSIKKVPPTRSDDEAPPQRSPGWQRRERARQ